MFDGLQILSNTSKHEQTRPNTIKHDHSTKQGVQTVKCLSTKQCLMVFGHQTCIVCPDPKALGKQEMFGDQTPSNIVGDQTFYRLDNLFGAV